MRIRLFTQIRDKDKIWYDIEHQKITATINGVSDTFDFTNVPNGILQLWDDEGNWLVETDLEEVPLVQAKKENGVLYVEILFSVDIDEDDRELMSGDWMTLGEFNALMKELADRDKPEEDESVDDVEADSDDSLEEAENIDIEEVDF